MGTPLDDGAKAAESYLQLRADLAAPINYRDLTQAILYAALEQVAGDVDHAAFLCHTHDDYGKGRERGLVDAVKIIRERRGISPSAEGRS